MSLGVWGGVSCRLELAVGHLACVGRGGAVGGGDLYQPKSRRLAGVALWLAFGGLAAWAVGGVPPRRCGRRGVGLRVAAVVWRLVAATSPVGVGRLAPVDTRHVGRLASMSVGGRRGWGLPGVAAGGVCRQYGRSCGRGFKPRVVE